MRRSHTARDHIVAAGLAAKRESESSLHQKGPWLYKYKVKVGDRATQNVESQLCNIKHLKAEAITEYAIENEPLRVFAVQRIMKSTMNSSREDI